MKTLALIQSKTVFPYEHNACICLIFWSEMYYAESSIFCGRMISMIFLLSLILCIVYLKQMQSIKKRNELYFFLIFFLTFSFKNMVTNLLHSFPSFYRVAKYYSVYAQSRSIIYIYFF